MYKRQEHGGSPEKAAKSAFVSAIDKYLRDQGKYQKSEGKITWADIEDCLVLVSNNFSTQTSYENQTKKAITNKFVQEDVYKRQPQRCQGDSRRAIDNRPYGGFDGAQDLLISLPGADGDEIRSRLAVIIGLQPQALPLGAFHGILSAIR